MAERVARKKGQHRGSSSHSDLYTDENPKGTIHGLKFATQKDAKASVNKIKSSGKSHAHKIQAAIAMEQRAKAAGKVSAAGEYRKFINMMKKKTKAKNENITIPIKVGDTVLGGKFKNKRIVVKSIGKNDKGDITINGRPLLKFRLVKEGIEVEFPKDMPMDESVSPQALKTLNLGLKKINRKFKGASLDGKTIDIELHPGHNRDSEIYKIYDLLKKLKLDKHKTSIFNDNVNYGDDEGPKDEGFASDAQRRAAFASGYKAKGKKGKKKEQIEEYDVENYQDVKEFIEFMKEYEKDIYALNPTVNEAEYQGRDVKLGKIMQGDVKKFKVYVKNPKGNVVKVNFGHKGKGGEKTMRIKKSDPARRKAFRSRHNCDNPGPRHKARYWACRTW